MRWLEWEGQVAEERVGLPMAVRLPGDGGRGDVPRNDVALMGKGLEL